MDIAESVNVDLFLGTRGEVDESRLAGAVAGAVRHIHRAGSTGDIKDATASLLPEERQYKAHERIWSVEVDLELLDELFWVLKMHLRPGLSQPCT